MTKRRLLLIALVIVVSASVGLGLSRQRLKRELFLRASPELVLFMKHVARDKGGNPFKALVRPRPEQGRVVCLAPHPDDESIGPGGTLLAHLAQGDSVHVVFMTDGSASEHGYGSPRRLAEVRRAEATDLCRALGMGMTFLDHPDQGLNRGIDQAVMELRSVLDSLRPDFLYLPSYFDDHEDHFAAAKIAALALASGDYDRITVMAYEVWTLIPFPNHIIDISEFFQSKLDMIAYHASQTAVFDFDRLCRLTNELRYMRHVDAYKTGQAEAFLRYPAQCFVQTMADYEAIFKGDR